MQIMEFFRFILKIPNKETTTNIINNVNTYHKYPIVLPGYPVLINIAKKLVTEKTLLA